MSADDVFDSPAFSPTPSSPPWFQVLNHQDPQKAGFFLSTGNAQLAEFVPDTNWRPYNAQFASGESVAGFLCHSAQFLILQRSPLKMYDRSGEYLGLFERQHYNQFKEQIYLRSRYYLFVVNQDRKLCHTHPLTLTTKGVFGASFGTHLNQFWAEMDQAYGKPRNHRFHALCLFSPRINLELKGEVEKIWVTTVCSHTVPTPDTWRDLFVGFHPQVRDVVLKAYDTLAQFSGPIDPYLLWEDEP